MGWRELACDAETLLRRVLPLAVLLRFFTRTAVASESGSRDKRNAGHQKEKFSHKLTTLSSSRESQVPRAEKAGRIDCAEAAPQDQSLSSFSFLPWTSKRLSFLYTERLPVAVAAIAAAVRVGLCLSGPPGWAVFTVCCLALAVWTREDCAAPDRSAPFAVAAARQAGTTTLHNWASSGSCQSPSIGLGVSFVPNTSPTLVRHGVCSSGSAGRPRLPGRRGLNRGEAHRTASAHPVAVFPEPARRPRQPVHRVRRQRCAGSPAPSARRNATWSET